MDHNSFDDRRRALEEEYFRKKDREALERLRAARVEEGEAERAVAAERLCPLGHGAMVEMAYNDVFIDRCAQCQGVWLDAGELERLMKRDEEGGFFKRLFGKSDEA